MENHDCRLGISQKVLSPLSMVNIFIAVLLLIASGSGLIFSSIYDTYVKGQTVPMLLGQDLLSLISTPILLFAIYV